MPRHDFQCPVCGHLEQDVYVPVTVGASHHQVDCPNLAHPYGEPTRLMPIPAIGAMSVFREFEKVTIPVEDPAAPGGFRSATLSTLADIRRLERESEQAERNGEGRRMIWRDFSQDPSNRDVHTIAPDPSRRPPKTFVNGQPVVVRRGTPVIADHGTLEETS